MLSLNQGLSADSAYRYSQANQLHAQAPADGFRHNGKLNTGPAIFLAVSLSLIAWAGIFGIGYMICHLV